ncbi:hypothetical protein CNMCM6106_005855 [Aspergillus hiratsukae]|uniref:Uncharacterized protein n=1 Tax=Aspergillus hiratsukae TaxID=1194566 RepID=A0A8H6QEZ7_9EURO|nr:hypothetical protein CNMCM6106_005855 [Aspergillus hiratsukae]
MELAYVLQLEPLLAVGPPVFPGNVAHLLPLPVVVDPLDPAQTHNQTHFTVEDVPQVVHQVKHARMEFVDARRGQLFVVVPMDNVAHLLYNAILQLELVNAHQGKLPVAMDVVHPLSNAILQLELVDAHQGKLPVVMDVAHLVASVAVELAGTHSQIMLTAEDVA